LAESYAAKPPRLGQEFKVGSKLLADLEHVGAATSRAPSSKLQDPRFHTLLRNNEHGRIMMRNRQTGRFEN
jgi:hypothetical protein